MIFKTEIDTGNHKWITVNNDPAEKRAQCYMVSTEDVINLNMMTPYRVLKFMETCLDIPSLFQSTMSSCFKTEYELYRITIPIDDSKLISVHTYRTVDENGRNIEKQELDWAIHNMMALRKKMNRLILLEGVGWSDEPLIIPTQHARFGWKDVGVKAFMPTSIVTSYIAETLSRNYKEPL